MPFEESRLKNENSSMAKMVSEARRKYFKKSLMQYGFTDEQAELLVQSLDEFVKEEKDLTEEAKESLYKE
jgi:hypothetical protein